MKQYRDFCDLIVLGHNAGLTPDEIYSRFVKSGLPSNTLPQPESIREIGRSILGDKCRWFGKLRAWSDNTVIGGVLTKIKPTEEPKKNKA